MDILLEFLFLLTDVVIFVVTLAIIIFGICGILFSLASFLHDFLCSEEEE